MKIQILIFGMAGVIACSTSGVGDSTASTGVSRQPQAALAEAAASPAESEAVQVQRLRAQLNGLFELERASVDLNARDRLGARLRPHLVNAQLERVECLSKMCRIELRPDASAESEKVMVRGLTGWEGPLRSLGYTTWIYARKTRDDESGVLFIWADGQEPPRLTFND